jgi:cell division transport system permease protein
VRQLAQSYGSSFQLDFLSAGDAVALVIFAAVLGLLGAQLSVGRHLRQIEPA